MESGAFLLTGEKLGGGWWLSHTISRLRPTAFGPRQLDPAHVASFLMTVRSIPPFFRRSLAAVSYGALVGVLAAWLLPTEGFGSRGSTLASLSLTSAKPVYAMGERPDFSLTITNASNEPITVAATDFGTVKVVLRRDGERVKKRSYTSFPSFTPKTVQKHFLKTLQPGGGTVAFPLTTTWGFGGWSLSLLPVKAVDARVNIYKSQEFQLVAAGTYSLTVSYQYKAKDAGGVFTGRLVSNPITFTIQ